MCQLPTKLTRPPRATGFTIVELLVVVSIIAILIGILLPAIGKAMDAARVTRSQANLRNLSVANGAYAADWADRQFTACPDDAGLVQGNCTTYCTTIACPAQQVLGWSSGGGVWGYWLGNVGLCNISSATQPCVNWPVYKPIEFFGGSKGFGSFRLPNVKAFSSYLSNRYYDPVFWAPKDKINLAIAEKYLEKPDEFDAVNGEIAFSTYCFSPAAMWSTEVFSADGFKDPNSLAGGWRSPAVGMATYPDLKTRMLEHSWLQNAQGHVNPNVVGGNEPWYFNHGYNSVPATLFFDGHVAMMAVADAMESDSRASASWANPPPGVTAPQERGLWHRATPFGSDGYFGAQSYDFLVNTSYHVLTTEGIQGRDTVGAR